MTLLGGLTFGGLMIAGAAIGFGAIVLIADGIAAEVRAFFGIDGLWAAEVRAHDHAADDDADAPVHSGRTSPETIVLATGKNEPCTRAAGA